jgi:hypothetical protein
MERALWKLIVASIRRVPRRCPRNAVYDNRQILAIHMWAALHDRPIDWATKRCNWPPQAWRRVLPDQSTMSRRLRDPLLYLDLRSLVLHLQREIEEGRLLLVDGKPFPMAAGSRDKDAQRGWAFDRVAKGYKLHMITDENQRVVGWDVLPMSEGEPRVAARLIERTPATYRARFMIGDKNYDSNELHQVTSENGVRLLAERKKPYTELGHRWHHLNRLRSIWFTEERGGWMWQFLKQYRQEIERYFSGLVCSGVGCSNLPNWVRRLHRVRAWVGAKIAINTARIAKNHAELA